MPRHRPGFSAVAAILATCPVAFACLAVVGCERAEVRQIDRLPPPRFAEPPNSWPTTAPADDRPLSEREAGWRNHVLPARQWRWIVIHHSATPGGDAAAFDAFHRDVRQWDELGYHFVIGNGTGSRDGLVQCGSRWTKQKHGAHCATTSGQFNAVGIGVCVVGDFESETGRPTARQWASLVALCRFLSREFDIPPDRIIGHRQAQATEGAPTTDCPGRNLDLDAVRRAAAE